MQWRAILLIYMTQMVFGVIVAVAAYNSFSDAVGASLELDRLAYGFDRSVFSDMINEFPKLIPSIRSNFIGSLLAFLSISVFLHAALLGSIRNRKYKIPTLLRNGRLYFLNFLTIAIVALIKSAIVLSIIWIPFIKIVGDPLKTFHSEKPFILTVIGLIVFSILLLSIIWLWSVLTRYHKVDGHNLVVAMKQGWTHLKSKFFQLFKIAITLILLHVLLTYIYTLVVDDWGAQTWFCVLGLILIQQVFSIIRVWIRVFGYTFLDYE